MRIAGAVVLLALLAAPALADREAAGFFAGRGRNAYEEGNLKEARRQFEKSLKELDGYAPALLGLAQIAHKEGRGAQAIELLRRCLNQRNLRDVGDEEAASLRAAEMLLGEWDRAGTELTRIRDDYIRELMELADRSRPKEPVLARECLDRILRLEPKHTEANRMMEGLGRKRPGPEDAGTPLWNGKNLNNWTGGPPVWTIRKGIMTGDPGQHSYWMRNRLEVKGDFSVELEMRVVKDKGSFPLLQILFGASGPYTYHSLWLEDDEWALALSKGENQDQELARKKHDQVLEGFNRFRWHTYRIEVKGRQINCYLGDRRIFSQKSPLERIEGYIGFKLQFRVVQIRRVILRK